MSHRPAFTLTRRRFLQGSGALGFGGALLAAAGPLPAHAAPGRPGRGDALVVVFLRGGLDALSACVPYQEPLYFTRRPTLAVPASRVLDLDGRFGLHPALAPLHEIFQEGDLAVVQAVGHPAVNRSHFTAQELWERGFVVDPFVPGWVARHLAGTPADGALRAVASHPRLPLALRGASGAIAVNHVEGYGLEGFANYEKQAVMATLSGLYPGADLLAEELATSAELARDAIQAVAAVDRLDDTPAHGAVYPDTTLGRRLRDVARMLRAPQAIPLDAAWIDVPDYDTHADQGTWKEGHLRNLLDELARALHAFHTDLLDVRNEVTLVVASEFGRQVHENGSGGTDHGDGGCLFVMGGGVRGGVYGRWPGLADEVLVRFSGLAVTTDFRDVLAEIVEKRLGHPDAGVVFPGHLAQPLGLVDGVA